MSKFEQKVMKALGIDFAKASTQYIEKIESGQIADDLLAKLKTIKDIHLMLKEGQTRASGSFLEGIEQVTKEKSPRPGPI